MKRHKWSLVVCLLALLSLSTCSRLPFIPFENNRGDEGTPTVLPQGPNYHSNAENWTDGPPVAILELTSNGLEVTALGKGKDPSPSGVISSCSYNFGDGSPPIEAPTDEAGNCGPATHVYDHPGGYNVVLAVWDNQGMIGQRIETITIGDTPGVSDRIEAYIAGCLETYAWHPDRGGPFPSIVHYTTYQIDSTSPNMVFIASGLATVYVTNRGQGSSCETTDLFGEIAQNDLLLIDQWLSEQPWATGDFCLQGHSGPGFMGTLSSTVSPQGLKCAFLGGADTKLWDAVATKSGAWWPVAPMWVINTYGEAAMLDSESRIPVLIDYLLALHRRSRDPSFFNSRDKTIELRTLDIPFFFETSWDDLAWGAGPLGGPYLDLVQEMTHPGSAVIIYPGPHPSFDPSNERPFRGAYRQGTAYLGEVREFILGNLFDGEELATSEFNYLYFLLKGGVQAAMMNRQYGGWLTSTSWPPENTSPLTLYLHSNPSGTIDARYDGSLFLDPPSSSESLAPFAYEPPPVWDPVYSSGGTPWKFYSFPDMLPMDNAGLTFTSPPLSSDTVIQGTVKLSLTAETDLYDFDWMVILSDIWPDGSSHRLSSGFLRASLRNNPEIYEPRPEGEQRYQITLASIANIFQAGHRIRLTIHQANSDDADPSNRLTSVRLGEGQAELTLHIDGGVVWFEPYEKCSTCDLSEVSRESIYAHLKWYITAGITGLDPISGENVSVGFWASNNPYEGSSGAVLAHLPGLIITAVGIDALAPTQEVGYDYQIGLPDDYRMLLRCGVEGDPGTLLITNKSSAVGPIEVSDGMIRCYDVPYANW